MAGHVQAQGWIRVPLASLKLGEPNDTWEIEIIEDRDSQTCLKQEKSFILLNAPYLVNHPGWRTIHYLVRYKRINFSEKGNASRDLTKIVLSTLEGQKLALKKKLKEAEEPKFPKDKFLAQVTYLLSEKYETQEKKVNKLFQESLELCENAKAIKDELLQESGFLRLPPVSEFRRQISLIGSADAMEVHYQQEIGKIEAVLNKIGTIIDKL